MPELVHGCGKKVRFPSGLAGRKGRCPHCGGPIQVPGDDQPAQHAITLDPPPDWVAWKAYFEDRGPPPRKMVMPQELMLQTDAEAKWERQAEVRPSKYFCPSCKTRINMDQVICTKCGLDFRTGLVLGGTQKLSAKGMTYLKDVPWLIEARKALAAERKSEKQRSKTSKLKKKKRTGTGSLAKATRRRRRFK